jgi:predicted metal-dependent peptidase
MLKLAPVVSDKVVDMAGVNSRSELLLNPGWVAQTTMEELRATMLHELLHVALLYFSRAREMTAMVQTLSGKMIPLANIAHDYVVNAIIEQEARASSGFLLSPKKWNPPGLFDARFEDMTFEQVYDTLLKEMSSKQSPSWLKSLSDSHADAIEDGEGGGTPADEVEQKFQEQRWKMAVIEAAMEQEGKQRGSAPAWAHRFIKEILDPRVPWADVLGRWVGERGNRQDYSYARPSRRAACTNGILAGMRKYGYADVIALIDTSGSMGQLLKEVVGEVFGILDEMNLKLRVMQCDTVVTFDAVIESMDDFEIIGGGGSDFCPAFDVIDAEGFDGVVIVFTDGEIDVPDHKPPHVKDVLWVVWGTDRAPADWGSTLNVDQEGMTRSKV